jgi:hypothetical protein
VYHYPIGSDHEADKTRPMAHQIVLVPFSVATALIRGKVVAGATAHTNSHRLPNVRASSLAGEPREFLCAVAFFV